MPTDQQIVRLLVEFMNASSRNGESPVTVAKNAQRAVQKAGLPEALLDEASALLARQGRC